jgi:hypothetical protein
VTVEDPLQQVHAIDMPEVDQHRVVREEKGGRSATTEPTRGTSMSSSSSESLYIHANVLAVISPAAISSR